jgi:8-oxo-dGTP pyrophosphatase MutT (NUDIX family)
MMPDSPVANTAYIESDYPVVAVNAIIFDGAKVLLTQRADNGLWCLPGGIVVFGETVQQALVRELEEEIGVRPAGIRLTGIYSSNNIIVTRTAKRCSIILAFECGISGQVPGLSGEVRAVEFFDLDSLPTELVENHEVRIRDATHRGSTPFVN